MSSCCTFIGAPVSSSRVRKVLLTRLEQFIADMISFTFLGSVRSGRTFRWLPTQETVTEAFAGLLLVLGLPFLIQAYFRPSENHRPRRLLTEAPFFFVVGAIL